MSEQIQQAPIAEAEVAAPETEQAEVSSESTENQELSVEQEKLDELSEKPEKDLSKEEKKEKQRLIKKFKLKVHGKEIDEEIDLENEEDLTRRFQLAKAAQVKMQESHELRKAAEQFIEMLRTNPRRVLTDPNIGVDLKALAQDIINEEIENASKSPEQLEKEKLQRELEELREKYKKDEEDRKNREFERLQAEQEEKIQSDIEVALKSSELPKTPYTVRKMAEMMMLALENNIDLSPKDIVPLLRKQMLGDIKELFSASSDDVLEEILGKDNISRLRKRTVSKVKQQQVAQTANSVKPTGADAKKPEPKEEKKMSLKDFLGV